MLGDVKLMLSPNKPKDMNIKEKRKMKSNVRLMRGQKNPPIMSKPKMEGMKRDVSLIKLPKKILMPNM